MGEGSWPTARGHTIKRLPAIALFHRVADSSEPQDCKAAPHASWRRAPLSSPAQPDSVTRLPLRGSERRDVDSVRSTDLSLGINLGAGDVGREWARYGE